ncbi:dephospho-CoA kinase [Rhodocyclus tenuis]|uniref:Dephospho-CoA kinase n=1 Tax=Rhodocyclus gracilis TaxID=2929842 RepID=A0ABX0WIJ6_9RHOO|nr:dephospho-CoA kinase [Rhodocyclus gracilis]MRD72368.1 dephospho-CoA kinase [Rhodocyclus gracilis]NJA89546.1 dephospho-CoA kinase [Rhodocyclus gracilis]
MSFIVGLTGGIGSGKSAVADCFAARGVPIIDTDLIAHALTAADGAAMPAIVRAFGESVVRADGALDRPAMRALVFADRAARARLEAILHPLIRAESDARCAAETQAPYLIVVVPLLVESGVWQRRVDRVLLVDCEEVTQIRRVVARSHLSPDEVRAIIAAQASRARRLAAADDVLHNDGDLAEIDPRVETLHQRFLEVAGAKLAAQR